MENSKNTEDSKLDPRFDMPLPEEMWYNQIEKEWSNSGFIHTTLLDFIRDKKFEVKRLIRSLITQANDLTNKRVEPDQITNHKEHQSNIEQLIEANENYLEFLLSTIKNLENHPKGTKRLSNTERYAYLEELGLFKTEIWRTIQKNSLIEDQHSLIADLLQCSSENARHIVNGKYQVPESKRTEIIKRIETLQKGV
jgi:hypothetical protein